LWLVRSPTARQSDVIDFEDEAAGEWRSQYDPYVKQGVFERVELDHFVRSSPDGEPCGGALMAGALSSLRSLKSARWRLAVRVTADGGMGAKLIKVERPGIGDHARVRGPFPGRQPHPEKSGLFL